MWSVPEEVTFIANVILGILWAVSIALTGVLLYLLFLGPGPKRPPGPAPARENCGRLTGVSNGTEISSAQSSTHISISRSTDFWLP